MKRVFHQTPQGLNLISKYLPSKVPSKLTKQGEDVEPRDPDAFYPKPNRSTLRKLRFGGLALLEDGSRPKRSRIQRGKSRPVVRGVILREGMPNV